MEKKMVNKTKHKFDEKSDRCLGCGLTEEQIEDRNIESCNGRLIKDPLKNIKQETKKKFI